jgi:MPBQ/MSBQ methyltransferase
MHEQSSHERIVEYYREAGKDYRSWSRGYNMHFGYWRFPIAPWKRERMLEEANKVVLESFSLGQGTQAALLDLGCGVGATMRCGAREYPKAQFVGTTLVPWQIEFGRHLTELEKFENAPKFVQGDFAQLPFEPERFDGAYSIEAAVHAEGPAKKDLISEAHRVLKEAGSFVVLDCFLKKPAHEIPRPLRYLYETACRGWAVKEMAEISLFKQALAEKGFIIASAKEVSWHVAPSVAHVPWVTLKHLLLLILKGEMPNKVRIAHVISCFTACFLGLARSCFGYYLIVAKKK